MMMSLAASSSSSSLLLGHQRRRRERRPVVVAVLAAFTASLVTLTLLVSSVTTIVGCWAWNFSASTTRRNVLASASGFLSASALAGGQVVPAASAADTTEASDANLSVKPGGKIRYGSEKDGWMRPKSHGTTDAPVQENLRYGVSRNLADRIVSYNRHYAEPAGYFTSTDWEQVVLNNNDKPVTFYDSVTGKPLFVAPVGRSAQEFVKESRVHGWPSFRDAEVVWDNVRILEDGETISTAGSHLGHNLPDLKGNRYCINLVSIAGQPSDEEAKS